MRRKAFVPMIWLLLAWTLVSCRGAELPHETYRRDYRNLISYSGEARVTADYGDKVYQYRVEITGDRSGGEIKVLEPSEIAGTGYRWQAGSGSAVYEDITLATGPLNGEGLSPADAMPVLLRAIGEGKELSNSKQEIEGRDTISLTLTNPSVPADRSQVQVWLDESSGGLRRGEILWEGQRVITLEFDAFTYIAQQRETEG